MTTSWLATNFKKIRTLRMPLSLGAERPVPEEVTEGSSFARFRSGDVVEIAQVLRVEESGNGVAHVRFVVTLRDRHGEYSDGPRTLGLEAFKRYFSLGAQSVVQASRWGPPGPRRRVSPEEETPTLRWPVRVDVAEEPGKAQKQR